MEIKKFLFRIMTICTIGMFVIGCRNRREVPQEELVNKSMNIAIYAAVQTEGKFTPVEPVLLQEKVSVDKLLHYDRDGAFITVPFHFKDSTGYAKITEEYIDKHIAITADGEVVATPMVKMRIGNGACSFLLSKEQALRLFPRENIEKLLSGSN